MPGYIVIWSDEAREEIEDLHSFVWPPLEKAAALLEHQAEVQTRNRKRLRREDLPSGYPDPTWEQRVGAHRRLYGVEGRTVTIPSGYPERQKDAGREPMSRYTAEEGRELSRRLARTHEKGGVPHAEIRREMLMRIERDLRKLARDYKGSARQAKQLLEALVIARDAGVGACDEIERELAERLRRRAA